jgi:hypothetical protein
MLLDIFRIYFEERDRQKKNSGSDKRVVMTMVKRRGK